MKTYEINKEIKIFVSTNLIGEDINLSDIERIIKNSPYYVWTMDGYNTFYVNDELVDVYVFETYDRLCFNIDEIF